MCLNKLSLVSGIQQKRLTVNCSRGWEGFDKWNIQSINHAC